MSTDDLIAVEDLSMELKDKKKSKDKLEKELKNAENKIRDADLENQRLKIEIRANEKDIRNLKVINNILINNIIKGKIFYIYYYFYFSKKKINKIKKTINI